MTYKYEEITDSFGYTFIKATDGDSVLLIPTDPANSDYQAYLNKDNPVGGN